MSTANATKAARRAEHLRALAEHPNTPKHEADAARQALARLLDRQSGSAGVTVHLDSPRDAVDPAAHTLDRVKAYLTGRGIAVVFDCPSFTQWGVPVVGDEGFEFEVPKTQSQPNYRAVVGHIAHILAWEDDVSELKILADIAATDA